MKQCPACKKTFEDSMKFCQTDGTPLVVLVENIPQTPTEENPFKTVVANAQSLREDDILQLPIEHDPMKTMVVSDFKKDIPLPKINQDVSQPLNPPIFDEPSLSPPNFGDLSPATPIKPIEVEPPTIMSPELPSFDATFTSMPLPSDSPFGSLPNKPNTSPFDQPMSSPFDTPKYEPPVFKEPEPIYTSQNEPFGNPFGQPNQMEQSAWTPPPAPDQNWANQGVGQNTPFQPPMVSSGQGQNQTLAIVSLVCGITSLLCLGFITGIPALVTGFMTIKNVNRDPNQYGGKVMAIIGMVLGGLGTLWSVLYVLFVFLAVLGSLGSTR
jgi:Domain of unknown function (DUF4190)